MMPKVPFLILVVSLNLKGSLYVSGTSVCGSPDDPCINEQNWARCRHLEEVGCENILVMESCPLQFDCDDNGRDNNDNNKEDIKDMTDSMACVTLKKYADMDCEKGQVAETVFSTFTEPGSPCYHEPGTEYSIKDQYCDLESGVFHQSVYWGSSDCDETQAPPMEQTYSKSSCLYGYKLGDCYKSLCFDESSSSEESTTA
mmetsp:Transcript_19712/g.23657  ORF Transcript_19712/g.23657 Transcript_19712/m.23657 type:complete len:200 (+) Transcript_19712:69-668(+)